MKQTNQIWLHLVGEWKENLWYGFIIILSTFTIFFGDYLLNLESQYNLLLSEQAGIYVILYDCAEDAIPDEVLSQMRSWPEVINITSEKTESNSESPGWIYYIYVKEIEQLDNVVDQIEKLKLDPAVFNWVDSITSGAMMYSGIASILMKLTNGITQCTCFSMYAILLLVSIYFIRKRTQYIAIYFALGKKRSGILGNLMLQQLLISIFFIGISFLLSGNLLQHFGEMIVVKINQVLCGDYYTVWQELDSLAFEQFHVWSGLVIAAGVALAEVMSGAFLMAVLLLKQPIHRLY